MYFMDEIRCVGLDSNYPLNPKSDWLLISPRSISQIKYLVYENWGNDHHFRELLIVKRILLVSTIKNVQRTVQRIPMSGK